MASFEVDNGEDLYSFTLDDEANVDESLRVDWPFDFEILENLLGWFVCPASDG